MGDRLGIPSAVGFLVLMYTYKFGFLLLKIMYDCFIKVLFALWGKNLGVLNLQSKLGNRHKIFNLNQNIFT